MWYVGEPDIKKIQDYFIDLFERGRNIMYIPHLLYGEDSDKEACYHYRSLEWMDNAMTDEEFAIHKQETIVEMDRRRVESAAEAVVDAANREQKTLEQIQALKDDLAEGKSTYNDLRYEASDYAYRGRHYEATIIKDHCRTTFPDEFQESDYDWHSIQPICLMEDCRQAACHSMQDRKRRGCKNDIYFSHDLKDIRLSYCLEHNTCVKCGKTSFWGENICESCDPATYPSLCK